MPLLIKIEKHYYLKTTESGHSDIPMSHRNRAGQRWGYRAQLSVPMSSVSHGIVL